MDEFYARLSTVSASVIKQLYLHVGGAQQVNISG